jgi:energy-coupling factor transporter ATP-binding protein EcfA2
MTLMSLVDPDYYIGTITFVGASVVQANLPQATARPERRRLARGAVGDFVFIDCENFKLLGRILEVKVPDAERLTLEPSLGSPPDPHPIGRIQLLATIDQAAQRLQRGLKTHPRVGDGIYLASGRLFASLVSNSTNEPGEASIEIGTLNAGGGIAIKLSAEKIFGRHCGVLGATGGGKSWTIATLLQQIKAAGGRAILFDPTGEFADLPSISKHYTFNQAEGAAQIVYFPYQSMTEDDLFTLVRPSGQSQGPKLRDAIKSLKLVQASAGTAIAGVTVTQAGLVEKMSKPRAPFFQAIDHFKPQINSPFCNINILNLPDQIQNECVWSSSQGNPGNWGLVENNSTSYCEALVSRLRTMIHSPELACLFGTGGASLVSVLNTFCSSEDDDIIRISLKNVRFEHHTREILLNIIGRYMLDCARREMFRERPMIVFLDEAHQFLGRTVGDEYGSVFLDAFGLIAKEGRKYGLSCTLATQRPRDIPADVLSQLGTLIVHRLTNDHDRDTVEKACGDLDREAAMFIPTLAPGEAIVIGPDVPAPVPLMISRPAKPPNSKGPPFNKYWTSRAAAKIAAASASAKTPSKTAKPTDIFD